MGRPKPFQHPRIEIVSEWVGSKREWMDVTPDRINVGDIIIGKGMVVSIYERVAIDEDFGDVGTHYSFDMKSGQRLTFTSTEIVHAFTQGVSPWLAPSNMPR